MRRTYGLGRDALRNVKTAYPLVLGPERPTDGWVYFMGAPFVPLVKIGWAVNPVRRLETVSQLSPVRLHLLTGFRGTLKGERNLHEQFAALRVHGEWFQFEGTLVDFVNRTCRTQGSTPWRVVSAEREPASRVSEDPAFKQMLFDMFIDGVIDGTFKLSKQDRERYAYALPPQK